LASHREASAPRKAKAGTARLDDEIKWVEVSVGDDDHSHLIDPEEYMQMIMSKQ